MGHSVCIYIYIYIYIYMYAYVIVDTLQSHYGELEMERRFCQSKKVRIILKRIRRQSKENIQNISSALCSAYVSNIYYYY